MPTSVEPSTLAAARPNYDGFKKSKFQKFPKPDVRLKVSPYPKFESSYNTSQTVNVEEALASEANPRGHAAGPSTLPQQARSRHRPVGKKIQSLIQTDIQWHNENNLRLSATVRQGRIPDMKYFTHQYDRTKINENKIEVSEPNMLIEKNLQLEENDKNGSRFKRVKVRQK